MKKFTTKRRLALYSHDTMGLGHMRRNLLIAQSLAADFTILLLAGARQASAFAMPPGVDCLTLPGLAKASDGTYSSRSLSLTLSETIALRARTLSAALDAFAPDLFLVDNVPRGAEGELLPALSKRRSGTRYVLGLRDVLDEPRVAAAEWLTGGALQAADRYFDALWVYGDPRVYALADECPFFSALASRISYVGYLDPRRRPLPDAARLHSLGVPNGPFALCLVGGGQDGAELAEAFTRAEAPPGVARVVVTGPFMARHVAARLRMRASARPDLRIFEFVTEPAALLARASAVVTMGGYNSVCEVLAYQKRALVVPRVRPRLEQLIRAERFAQLGALDVLHPGLLSPRAISEWLHRPAPTTAVRTDVDLNGLARLPVLIDAVLARPERRSRIPARRQAAG